MRGVKVNFGAHITHFFGMKTLLLYASNLFLRMQTKPEGEYQDGVPNSARLTATVHFL